MPNSRQYHQLYATAKWRKLRKRQLQAEPLCRYCLRSGFVTPATVADHIQPHRGKEWLFFDIENLQSLCTPCHNTQKRQEEIGGFSTGAGVDGEPLDPNHPWR